MKLSLIATLLMPVLFSMPVDNAFRTISNESGVNIEMANVIDGPPWIRASFEIAANVDSVVALLSHFEDYQQTFSRSFKQVTVLEQGTQFGAPYARMHLVFPPLKRWQFWKKYDGVVLYSMGRNGRGNYLLSWQPQEKLDDPTLGERLPDLEGNTELIAVNANKTKIIHTYRASVGMGISDAEQQAAWLSKPLQYQAEMLSALGLKP